MNESLYPIATDQAAADLFEATDDAVGLATLEALVRDYLANDADATFGALPPTSTITPTIRLIC